MVEPVTANHNASSRSVARNAAVGYGTVAVSLLLGFLATPIIFRELGQERFGTYALVGGLVGYLAIADIGVGTATTNRVARCHAVGDQPGLRTLLATSFWIFCSAGVVGLVVALALAMQLGSWFTIPPELVGDARTALLVLALGQSLGVPMSLYSQVLIGAGRLDLVSIRTMIFSAISSGAQILVVLGGGGLAHLAAVSATTGLLGALFLRRQVRRAFPEASIAPRSGSRRLGRDLLGTGSRNVAISIAGMVSFTSDVTVLAAIGPISSVAAYAVSARLVSYARLLSSRLSDVLMPVYAHSDALSDEGRRRRILLRTTTVSLAMAIPMTVCFVAFGQGLLEVWLGEVPAGSYSVLVVLSLASLAQLPGHNCFILLTANERTKALLRISVAAAAVNLTLTIVLTQWLGVVGPALGTLMVVLVADVGLLPLIVCREYGWRWAETVGEILRPLVWPTLSSCSVGAVLVLAQGMGAGSAPLSSGAVVVVFGAVAYRTVLAPSERDFLRRQARLPRRGRP